MKKTILIVLALVLCLSVVSCGKKDQQVAGGWTDAADKTVTDEIKEIMAKAAEGDEATYEPVELVGTQVVAGMNYKILCNVTKNGETTQKVVTVYKDLDGNCKITNVADK